MDDRSQAGLSAAAEALADNFKINPLYSSLGFPSSMRNFGIGPQNRDRAYSNQSGFINRPTLKQQAEESQVNNLLISKIGEILQGNSRQPQQKPTSSFAPRTSPQHQFEEAGKIKPSVNMSLHKEDKKTQNMINILKPFLEKSRRESPVIQHPKLTTNFSGASQAASQSGNNEAIKTLLMKFVSKKQQEQVPSRPPQFPNQPDSLLKAFMTTKAPTFSARNVSEVSAVSHVSKPTFVRNFEGSSDGAKQPQVIQPKFNNKLKDLMETVLRQNK